MDSIIYKYPFQPKRPTEIRLPVGAELLKVGAAVPHEPHLWFKVPTVEGELESRTFWVYGTGEAFDDRNQKHVDTFFDQGYVWHVFEVVC